MRQLLWLLFVLPACSSAGPGADASAVDARAIDSPPADGAVATDAGVVPDTGPPTPLRVLFVGTAIRR